MFHDTRESLCFQEASVFGDVRENLCVTWLCASLKGMGAHVPAVRLKAERARKSVLVTMMERQRVAWALKVTRSFNWMAVAVSRGYPSSLPCRAQCLFASSHNTPAGQPFSKGRRGEV